MARRLLVTHDPHWGVYPEGPVGDLVQSKSHTVLSIPGWEDLLLETWTYSPYRAWGITGAPMPVSYPVLNNVVPYDRESVDVVLRDLRMLSDKCSVLVSDHARMCPPELAQELPDLFPLRVLLFADDGPGSSELKTLPIARHFDVLVHCMQVQNWESGETVPQLYAKHGLQDCRFRPSTTTRGLGVRLAADQFHAADKIASYESEHGPRGFTFVGSVGPHHRVGLLFHLMSCAPEIEQLGLVPRFHGKDGCMHGPLHPLHPPEGDGWVIAPLYEATRFGLNIAYSSLYNTRLMDLWTTACVPVMQDRWNELALVGAEPGVHYLAHDGTAQGVIEAMRSADPGTCARIAQAGYTLGRSALEQFDEKRIWRSILHDYESRLP